jgi:putative spermidine/putrescine transport system substrate-binding protein
MTSHLRPTRRAVLRSAAGLPLLAAPALHVRPARAQGGELVVASWGGSRAAAFREVMFAPFERETGIKVRDDGPPEAARVRAMSQAGNVTWDILDTDIPAILTMAKNELLHPIDYSRLTAGRLARIPEVLKHEYGIGHLIYSFNIVYNTRRFPDGRHPKSWTEVWDGAAFPGGRSFPFRGGITPQLEFALLADGVAPAQLYPMDVDRAWRSMDRLRPVVTKWYANHAEAMQLVTSGEVDIACTIGPRAVTAKREGAPVDVEWNQGKLAPDNWAIPKGTRNLDAVYKFLDFALDPRVQAEVSKRVPYGPSNLDAFNHMTEGEAAVLNTSPANLSRQFWHDTAWWGATGPDGKTNVERETERYARWMLRRS